MSASLHALYPDLKAKYDHFQRVRVESKLMYAEVQEHYPEVSTLVSWGAFDPQNYPIARQRSPEDEGLVVCAAYQKLKWRQDRLWDAYHVQEKEVQRQHREKVVWESWNRDGPMPHPILAEIDALDEDKDLMVGYVHWSSSGETHMYRGLTKSQCPLFTEGMRLLFKNRGNPKLELANQAPNGCWGGIFDIIPRLFKNSRGVDHVADKFRRGALLEASQKRGPLWGKYKLGEQHVGAIGKLDKYLSFPEKGMPEPGWYQLPIYDELSLFHSNECRVPRRDYGPVYALCFAYMMGKDGRYGPAFKDVFVAYVQAHPAMFWRWKVRGFQELPPEGKEPLFLVVD